jgi:GNAT superfamily N-acetyltransferase
MLAEPGQSVLVAESNGQVIGLATIIVRHVIHYDTPFARLAALVVATGRRKSGVGAALVEAAERIARGAGCSVMEITSGDHRPEAHAFYRRLGFDERPRRFVKRLD